MSTAAAPAHVDDVDVDERVLEQGHTKLLEHHQADPETTDGGTVPPTPPQPPGDDRRRPGGGGDRRRHRWKRILLWFALVLISWLIGYFIVGRALAGIAHDVEQKWED